MLLYPVTAPDNGYAVAISAVSENGGPATLLPTDPPSDGEVNQLFPRLLPDGRHFVYTNSRPGWKGTLRAGEIGQPARKAIMPVTGPVAYVDGFLFFLRDAALVAQRFDAETLSPQGDVVPIADDVDTFSVSDSGVIVYDSPLPRGEAQPNQRLVWMSRRGERLNEVTTPLGYYERPALSPDGHRIAVGALAGPKDPQLDVWLIDLDRGTFERLTIADAKDSAPLWSHDGARIAFGSGRDGMNAQSGSIYARPANAAGSDEILFKGKGDEFLFPTDWLPDGTLLFVRAPRALTNADVWVRPPTGEPYALIQSTFVNLYARVSPDGRWMAYTTNQSNRYEVVVRPFPAVDQGQWTVSTNGGAQPRWRAEGGELYYVDLDGNLMAVAVGAGTAFQPGLPQKLFTIPGARLPSFGNDDRYDVTADGQRFLVNEPLPREQDTEPQFERRIHLVSNWRAIVAAQ
jgi:Tol biopolymer transport system component